MPVDVGQSAPGFTLPSANKEGSVSLSDYRGKTPVKTVSGLRLITAKNVKMGYVQETPMEYVSPKSYDAWMTRGIPRRGDVLFGERARNRCHRQICDAGHCRLSLAFDA